MFLLHKRVIKAISFQKFISPSTPFFSDLQILKLHDLFQLKLLCFVYDCVNKIYPSCFHYFFELVESVHLYRTRQATNNNIFLNRKNTLQYDLRSVCYFGAKFWNNTPSEIKSSPSAYTFCRKLKTFFFDNNYIS